jgi:Resolvase, N terminal domain
MRPQREELLQAARRREIDLVLVWRLDRWGRSLVDLVTTLQELMALGVGFVSLSEALDMTTPSGRALACSLSSRSPSAIFSETASEQVSLRHAKKGGLMDVHPRWRCSHLKYAPSPRTESASWLSPNGSRLAGPLSGGSWAHRCAWPPRGPQLSIQED